MHRQRIESFEEFWPFYVREHALPATRMMHFIGTSLGIAVVAAAIITEWWWLLPVAPVFGYGMAWISHFGIEKNKPASFHYPLWSFIGDIKLWALMLTGRMGAEADRILGARAK